VITPLEAAAALTAAAAVVLTVRESVWCWPVGLVSIAMYAVVFAQARLYGAAGLQAAFAAAAAYGWWAWLRGGTDGGHLRVSRIPRAAAAAIAAATAVVAAALGLALARYTDAAAPHVDGALAAASLAAQGMQARKWIENWWVWIAVDVAYVGLFLSQRLPVTAALYALFCALAATGVREWRRSLSA